MYHKNFDVWNVLKKKTDGKNVHIYFHEREIWIAHLGINVGIEQNGHHDTFVRPILIIKKFSIDHMLILPLTSRQKDCPYFFPLTDISFLNRKSWLNISQIRVFDSKRLDRKLGKISKGTFNKILSKTARTFSPCLNRLGGHNAS